MSFVYIVHELTTFGGSCFMRKLVFFIIAMMALFNLIRAFAIYNDQTTIPVESLEIIETPES